MSTSSAARRLAATGFTVIALGALFYFLANPEAAAAAVTNLLSNPSAEDGGATPTGWTDGSYGTNTRTVTTVAPGRTDLRALKVTLALPYTDGDAKWITPSTTITPGQYYTFKDWYKSDAPTQVGLFYNGTQDFEWLADLPASADWTPFEVGFIAPAGATSVAFTHLVASVGTLTTDDYSLSSPAFATGMVTLTFDDGWKSIATNAIPLLDAAGYKTTQYIYTQPFMDEYPDYMSTSTLRALQAGGHEIGSHTRTHIDLTLPAANLASEIAGAKADLLGAGLSAITTFAYPYGNYCAGTNTDCATTDVRPQVAAEYIGARSVDEGYNLNDSDPYTLKIQHVTNLTTEAEIDTWVQTAKNAKAWLILMFHRIEPTTDDCLIPFDDDNNVVTPDVLVPDEECTTTAIITSTINSLASSMVPVKTMAQGLAVLASYAGDTTAPVIVTPVSPLTAVATSPSGAVVNYTVTVTDNADATPTASCTPLSGIMYPIGDTTVACSATDASSNSATASFVIRVINDDHLGPVVTLSTVATSPTNAASIPFTVTFNEEPVGFEVADITLTGGTLSNFASTTALTYTFLVAPSADGTIGASVAASAAVDLFGNTSSASNLIEVVSDRTKPVITLNGSANIGLTTADTYGTAEDAGATALDTVSGDLTSTIVVTGLPVNTLAPGVHTVTYNVTDAAGNAAVTVTRLVAVSDQSAPLFGAIADITVEATSNTGAVVTYSAPLAADDADGAIAGTCTPASDTTFGLGSTPVSCTAVDSAGNSGSGGFMVIVRDTTVPTITAPGAQTFEATAPLTTPTLALATATDTVDASPVITFTPSSFAVGTHTVTWTATDASGNTAAATSQVTITDTGVPVLTLIGGDTVTVSTGSTFVDPGATATDLADGDLTAHIVVTGTVPAPATTGSYTLTYNVTDSASHAAVAVTRTVVVSDLAISGESNGTISPSSITILWTTTHNATSRVVWDTVSHTNASTTEAGTPNYGYANSAPEDATLVTSHSVNITGLSPATTYYFRTISHGSPEVFGVEQVLNTPAPAPAPSSGGGGGGGGNGGGGAFGSIGSFTPIYAGTSGIVLGVSTSTKPTAATTIADIAKFIFKRALFVGLRHTDVTELQTRLTAEGVYTGPITGFFGPLTRAGVMKYQEKNNIEQAGIVGPKTRAALNGQ